MSPIPFPARRRSAAVVLAGGLVLLASGAPARAQTVNAGARAIGLYTHADPAVGGQSYDEVYLTQPMLLGMAAWRGLDARITIDLEGWTLDRGELNAGISGEGYVDRRHPHTFLHEAVLGARSARGRWRGSLAIGRGFAPFGTDDPMVRPLVKYPANHHLAQILERWIAIGAVGYGAVTVEAGAFNGDEPTEPQSLGRLSRFGDSWSARLTVRPVHPVELQLSHARVASPEHAFGAGLDQRKWSASGRFEGRLGNVPVYGLAEYARTDEYARDRRAYSFVSALIEGSSEISTVDVALRFERTSRPEEERLADPFRSVRPHTDGNIVGVTRWRSVTLHAERTFTTGTLRWTPLAEATLLDVEEITGSIFDPVEFYGDTAHWSLSFGLRIEAGAGHRRMGRYGAALDH